MQYFNIQVASQLSGVAAATIRAWEKRYNAVNPDRGENHHRLYSETDIEKLALLFKLTELGQSIGKIAHLNLPHLKEIYTGLMHRPYDEKQIVTAHHNKIDINNMLSNLFLALASYKIDILSHELDKVKSLLTPKDLCLKILVPLFKEIGVKVANKQLTIAQEHTLSAIVSFHMGQMIGLHYQKGLRRQELILITTPEGELHEIGILGAALLCVHYGLKFIFLGASLPAYSLAEASNALKPHAVLIGVSGQELSSQNIEEYLKVFFTNLTTSPKLWLGGNVTGIKVNKSIEKNFNSFSTLEAFDEFLSKF